MKHKVSVIVPFYNVENYIGDCLESIIGQTYDNLEIILVDDGSTDNSLKIAKDYREKDKRITILQEENSGQSVARNKALDVASGDYLLFVDADDFIAGNMVRMMLLAAEKTGSDVVCCQWNRVYGDDITTPSTLVRSGIVYRDKLMNSVFLDKNASNSPCAKLFKRTLWEDSRFPENIKFEDVLIIPLVLNKCRKAVLLKDGLYYYRDREGSTVHTHNEKILKDFMYAINEVDQELRSEGYAYFDYYVFLKYNQLLRRLKWVKDRHELVEVRRFYVDNFRRLFSSKVVPFRRKMVITYWWVTRLL